MLNSQNSTQSSQNQHSNIGKGNRLNFHGDRHFTYDDRGNLTEERRGTGGKLSTKYTYNSQNQLIKVEKGGQVFEYAYDPLGRRIRKKDAFGETEYLYNGDVLLSEKRKNQEKLYLFEPNSFRPLCFIENNQCYFYHNDHLGTPQEITTWEGQVVWSARYKVYGNVVRKDVEAVENNLRAPGQYYDAESGLHYSRHRYYDPGTGNFITPDPIGLLGGINNYVYASNPVMWIDPLGLVCKERYERYKAFRDQGLSAQDAAKLSKTKNLDQMSIPQNGITTFPGEPWQGVAHQEYSLKALDAREQVEQGTPLYRIGKMGKSDTAEAQFWAVENPNSAGYAARYGIPKPNVESADFYEVAVLKPNAQFVTRSAPPDPDGINPGGAIEVVVNASDVKMKSFSAGTKTPYTGN